jgi:hypothetical protein
VKSKRIVQGVLLLLLLGVCAWIARHTYWDERRVPLPWHGEALSNPFYAAQRFAAKLGARSLWDPLAATPPADAVMVLANWNWDLSRPRRERLQRWVEGGGRLVMDESVGRAGAAFERWSGIRTVHGTRDEDHTDEEGEEPARPTAFEPCQPLRDPAGHEISVCDFDPDRSFRSSRPVEWSLRDARGDHALRVRVGRGSVTVIGARVYTYRELFRGNHAELLVASTQLRRGDEIRFLSEPLQPSLFALSWRHGAPVLVLGLALILLALWRKGAAFGPVALEIETARRSLAEQIRGTGQFALRFGDGAALHAATLRALAAAAAGRIAGWERLTDTERAVQLARCTGVDAGRLAAALLPAVRPRPHELRNAIALIEATRRRILAVTKGPQGAITRRSHHGS